MSEVFPRESGSNSPDCEEGVLHTGRVRDVCVIVFTDVVGSTALRAELGDTVAGRLEDEHNRLMRRALETCEDGQIVKTEGDGHLLVFRRPGIALQFALRAQALHRKARAGDWPELPEFRVGVHMGTVLIDMEQPKANRPARIHDIHGLQVDLTARIMDLASGGQILCSRSVFDDARQALKGSGIEDVGTLAWVSHGPYMLKGRDEPLSICEVGEEGVAGFLRPSDTAKAKRLDYSEEVGGWRPAPDVTLPGTNWVMSEKLGEGGFGEVWLARDRTLPDRATVFKFCTHQNKVPSLRRELDVFNQLARLAGGKSPSGIVEVYGAHDMAPPYYIQLQFVSGGDLRQWIENNGAEAPFRMRLDLAIQMTRALARVHAAGVTHRDVKPSNYLCEPSDDPAEPSILKLSDFGIGQASFDAALESQKHGGDTVTAQGGGHVLHTQTISSAAVGAFFFIAPELVLSGSTTPGTVSKRAKPASDIYSLGVSLYQLFAGSTSVVPGPGMRDVTDPVLREDLEACLEQDPDVRPSADELAERLGRYDERREALVAAERKAEEERHAETRRLLDETREAHRRESEARREIEAQAYCHAMLLADRYFADGNYAPAVDLVWQAPEHLRHWEWGFLAQQTRAYDLILEGHEGEVLDARFSPDGKWIATAGADHTARIWDAHTGQIRHVLDHGEDAVAQVLWTPDSKRLLSVALLSSTQVWDTESGLPFCEPIPSNASSALSPDGSLLCTRKHLQDYSVWRLKPGKADLVIAVRDDSPSKFGAFSPDGSLLAIPDCSGAITIVDLTNNTTVRKEPPNRSSVQFVPQVVAFSPSGNRLLVASAPHGPPWRGTMALWDTTEWCQDRVISSAHPAGFVDAAWSPDGQSVATVLRTGGLIEVYEAESGQLRERIEPHRGNILAVRFSPDGSGILTASNDGTARIWDCEGRKQRAVFVGHSGAVYSAEFNPTGDRVVTASADGIACVWSARNALPGCRFIATGPDCICCEAFSPDGKSVVTASRDGSLRLWDAHTGVLLAERESAAGAISQIGFAPTGDSVVAVSDGLEVLRWRPERADGPLEILRLQPQSLETTHRATGVNFLEFTSDSRFCLTGYYSWAALLRLDEERLVLEEFTDSLEGHFAAISRSGRYRTRTDRRNGEHAPCELVDTTTGEALYSWSPKSLGPFAAFSCDERYLAVATKARRSFEIVDVQEKRRISEWPHPGAHIVGLASSPSDGLLATICVDDIVRIHEFPTGNLLRQLKGHTGLVISVAFSPDGKRLVSASHDGTVRLWDVAGGRLLVTLRAPKGRAKYAEFSPDGRRILTGWILDGARIWTAAPWNREELPGTDDMSWDRRMALYLQSVSEPTS